MRKFSRDSKPDRRSPRRSNRRDSDRFRRRDSDRGPREMFKVICDECGKEDEVPFKPSSDKPIYCSECFRKKGDSRGNKQDLTEEFEKINDKLDRILEALEK